MTTATGERESDAALARRLATEAGSLLLTLRTGSKVATGGGLGALGDREAHEYLCRELRAHRPHDAVLSEEGADDPARLRADRVWIVDPLDGTREFTEPGRTDWAVHVALWRSEPADATGRTHGGRLVAGAVALPALGQTHGTDPAPRLPAARPGRMRIAVSRTRAPALAQRVAAELDAELVPLGSAGVKAMAVLRAEADAYLHAGGLHEWDSAAPVAVATAAGLHASRLDGTALTYNRADPLLPDLVVCRPELATTLLATVAREQDRP
jgi:3'(2'), 5'-bisphosphate nucleotidase